MLSCTISGDTRAPGCCRLAGSHRGQARVRRYPSDTTDAQWAVIDRLLPEPSWLAGRGGRPESHCRRQVVDAILYVLDNGIKWRALPADFPPWSTVFRRFATWAAATGSMMDALTDRARLAAGRTAAPSAAVIDSQSVRAAETVSRDSRGWDNAKKVNGRKRHIAVDTQGLPLAVMVTPASTQDRAAAWPLLTHLRHTNTRARHVWADGGYSGYPVETATDLDFTIEIVNRPRNHPGFVVLPRRWVVERTLAWITRHRRCVRDYERTMTHHEAFIHWAITRILTLRLTR